MWACLISLCWIMNNKTSFLVFGYVNVFPSCIDGVYMDMFLGQVYEGVLLQYLFIKLFFTVGLWRLVSLCINDVVLSRVGFRKRSSYWPVSWAFSKYISSGFVVKPRFTVFFVTGGVSLCSVMRLNTLHDTGTVKTKSLSKRCQFVKHCFHIST